MDDRTPTCPGCGLWPLIVMDGGRQAFCFNDACYVLVWDPTQPLADQLADAQVTDIPPDFWRGGY